MDHNFQKYINNEKSCNSDYVFADKLKNLNDNYKNGKKILIKGNNNLYETYSSWNNSSVITFDYTVVSGDSSSDLEYNQKKNINQEFDRQQLWMKNLKKI